MGCGAGKKTLDTSGAGEKEKSEGYDESFDPLTLDDDDITIQKKSDNGAIEEQITSDSVTPDQAEQTGKREIDGWRVQILATKNIENATLVHQEASDQFALSDLKVYLIFEAPLYKVRVGDAATRNEAETVRELARDYGYVEAFAVRSKVFSEENSESGQN